MSCAKQENLYRSKISLALTRYGDFVTFAYLAMTIKWLLEMKKTTRGLYLLHCVAATYVKNTILTHIEAKENIYYA